MANRDCDITSGGVRVIGDEAGKKLLVGGEVISLETRPLFVSADEQAGEVVVAFAGGDDLAYRWSRSRGLEILGPTDGVRPVLVTGDQVYWVVKGATHYRERNSPAPIPIPIGRTSQGIAYLDGQLVWADTLKPRRVKGHMFHPGSRAGDWEVGLSTDNQIMAVKGGELYKASHAGNFAPRARVIDGKLHIAVNRFGFFLTEDDLELVAEAPIEPPAPPMAGGCYPRKMLFAPFFSYSNRYGVTNDPIQNVSWIEDNVVAPDPYIQDVKSYRPGLANTTIAVWMGVSKLAEEPEDYQLALSASKPVILYVDTRTLPAALPPWLDIDRTWLGVQAYRGAGESVEEFQASMKKVLDKVGRDYKLPIVLTLQAYDRNGEVNETHAIESLRAIEPFIYTHRIVGLMPFADRRPGGMADYPALREEVRRMFLKVPGRPNRFDYWGRDNDSLAEKLLYDVPQLTAEEKAKLRHLLKQGPSEPPFPGEPPVTEPPVLGEIEWLHADVSGWPETSRVLSLSIDEDTICINHTQAGQWPNHPNHPIGEGNPWVIAMVDGRWYAATYEWLRTGQVCKHIEREGEWGIGAHTKKEPLESWVPRKGELVGFFVSTFARDSARTINERSNIVWKEWPY